MSWFSESKCEVASRLLVAMMVVIFRNDQLFFESVSCKQDFRDWYVVGFSNTSSTQCPRINAYVMACDDRLHRSSLVHPTRPLVVWGHTYLGLTNTVANMLEAFEYRIAHQHQVLLVAHRARQKLIVSTKADRKSVATH